MKNRIFFLTAIFIFLFSGMQLVAQQLSDEWLQKNAVSSFNAGRIDAGEKEQDVQEYAKEYLYNALPVFKNDERNRLRLIYKNESPAGYHLQFSQTFTGKEIFGTEVKINISKEYNILSLFEKTISTNSSHVPQNFPDAEEKKILNLLAPDARISVKKVFFVDENLKLLPAYNVDYIFANELKHEELLLSTDYKIIYRQNLNLNSGKRDTAAKGYIFLPDPLSTAKKMYGAPYIDNKDTAVFELDMQRKLGFFNVTTEEDSMYLESKYIRITDLADPFTKTTFSKNGNFFYSRSEPGFEDVNTFFHLNTFQEYVQKLGFINLAAYQLRVDAHGKTDDNSEFVYNNNDFKLLFGIGGVDDAEDADVIIHEYCHAISHSASNSAFGYERLILEEGLCDYFACSYSKSVSQYNWERLFNWDGHNPFYEGRWCVTDKHYANPLSGGVHKNADLWAGAMMDVHDGIGREKTDRLMLLAMYSFSRNMKLSDAAKLIVQADTLLYNGKNVDEVANRLIKYGLLPQGYHKTGINDEVNSGKTEAKIETGYFSSDNFLYIKFNRVQNGRAVLYDLQGKQIYSGLINNDTQMNIYLPELSKGLYILNISTDDIQQSVKLLKQ